MEQLDQLREKLREPGRFVLVLFLGVYLLGCGAASAYIVIDSWSGSFLVWEWLFPALDPQNLDQGFLKTFSYTVAGSIIGAVMISFKGLHEYGAVQGSFVLRYTPSYLVGPWIASLMGIAVYGLVRGGVFIFAGAGEIESPNEATQLGYLGLGVVVGFAWDKVLTKLESAADQVLGMEGAKFPETERSRSPENPTTRSAGDPER
jgi:hypothetical protein